MRTVLVLVVAACGGSGGAKPIDNTTAATTPEKRWSVIPEGNYSFAAAPTEDALMSEGEPKGTCTTGVAGAAQQLTCEQATPEIRLQGTFEAKEGVHFTSSTYSGELQYSDAVVLLGGLKNAAGASLFVRLELTDCRSVEDCTEAFKNARQCK